MRLAKALIVLRCLIAATSRVLVQDASLGPKSKPDKFSPLGFDDLRAYEQAYPGTPGSALVVQASAQKYWAFRGVAYRGLTPSGNVWTSLGPETTIQDATSQQKTASGRV